MRLRPMIGWGMFLFLVAIIAQVLPSPRSTYYYFKGQRLESSRQYKAAADAYQQSVKSDPEFARGYIELGSMLTVLERYDEAEAAYKKATSIEDDSCASCGLGMIYRLKGQSKEAETTLRHAIQVNPKDTCAYDQLGRLYYDQENYAKAIESFSERVKITPNAVTYHFLGNANYFSGKFEESLKFYEKSASLNPTYADFYADYGRAFNRLNRHKEAIEIYERGLRVEPNDVMLHVGRGFTQFGIGNDDEAMVECRKLQKLDPEWAERLLKAIKTASFEKEVSTTTR